MRDSRGLPTWMFNPDCVQFVTGQPLIAGDALLELRDLLKALRTPSPVSSVSLKMPQEDPHETSAGFKLPTTPSSRSWTNRQPNFPKVQKKNLHRR